MLYCPRCGTENPDDARFCAECGNPMRPAPDQAPRPAPEPVPAANPNATAELETRDQVLIFCGNLCLSPVLGIVLYFVWKDEEPAKAKQACHLTLASFAIWVVLILFIVVVSILEELG